jgi:RNA polymerase-interacting CarD/CdnL/TRCF family regulator
MTQLTTSTLGLEIGDLVVHGRLGIGRVARKDSSTHPGSAAETIVIEFDEGLSVTLPVEEARTRLRPPAGGAEIASVERVLRAVDEGEDLPWRTRTQAAEEKLAKGEPTDLAEIVHDAARREQRPGSRDRGGPLSGLQRRLYVRARQLLAAEVGAFHGTDTTAADSWITEQLNHNLLVEP